MSDRNTQAAARVAAAGLLVALGASDAEIPQVMRVLYSTQVADTVLGVVQQGRAALSQVRDQPVHPDIL